MDRIDQMHLIEDTLSRIGGRVSRSGNEAEFEKCPYCQKRKKFYLNTETGLFKCFHGECEAAGNIYRLRRDSGLELPVNKAGGALQYKRPEEKPEFTKNVVPFHEWYEKERGINADTLKKYGVGCLRKHGKDYIVYHYRNEHGELVNRKFRCTADKKEQFTEKGAEHTFYGLQEIDFKAKRLHIVEGEDDAHAGAQIGLENVVSLPNGAGNYSPGMEQIAQRFEEVVLLCDNDPAGQIGARKVAEKIGLQKCKNVILPFKDLRDCLKNGMDIFDLQKEINAAARFRCESIIKPADESGEIVKSLVDPQRVAGQMIRMPGINRILGGVRLSELSILTAHTGCGKTTFAVNFLLWCQEIGLPGLAFFFENRFSSVVRKFIEARTRERIYQYNAVENKNELRTPPEWITRQVQELSEREIWFFNKRKQNASGYYDLKQLTDTIEYAVKFHEVKIVVIDHLHYFLKLSGARNPVHEIDEAVRQLKTITDRLNVHMLLIVHPHKTADRDGKLVRLGLNSGKGASSISQEADNFFVIGKNAETRQAKLNILKNREFGRTGEIVFDVLENGNTFVPEGCRETLGAECPAVPEYIHN